MKNRVIVLAVFISLMVAPVQAAKKQPDPVPFKNRNPDLRLQVIADAMPRLSGKATAPKEALSLWYRSPAEQWVYALPIGNGRFQ